MTYRERRERRAERLRGWAAKREAQATATLAADRAAYGGDIAFATQPGHIPLRARVIARTDRALSSLNKAEEMAGRADEIEAQMARSIYSDDPDAIERLTERIAALEARRESIKAYNASCRKGQPDESLLSLEDRQGLAMARNARQVKPDGQMPGYVLANLAGDIKRNRDRLARLSEGHA